MVFLGVQKQNRQVFFTFLLPILTLSKTDFDLGIFLGIFLYHEVFLGLNIFTQGLAKSQGIFSHFLTSIPILFNPK